MHHHIHWTCTVNQLNQHLDFPSKVKLNPFLISTTYVLHKYPSYDTSSTVY